MKYKYIIAAVVLAFSLTSCCDERPKSSDDVQRESQEKGLKEITAKVPMPSCDNAREKRMAADIISLRDQEGLTTYTYLHSEMTGKLVFFGESVGYGLPAATQFSNPQKYERVNVSGGGYGYQTLPQADPNGLFSPASADGTWVMMKDPNGTKVLPVFIEPRCVVSPFKLVGSIVEAPAKTPAEK